jgi:putative phosphoribosyl transferase
MLFLDRTDGGRQLAARLRHLRGEDPVVLGLPRGGVPVAAEVARALDAPLDVIVVRKLGVPFQPELAMGAVGEEGVRILNPEVVRATGVTAPEIDEVEVHERAELRRRVRRFRGDRPALSLVGRTVVIVDDGIATGATARAACLATRARGARRIVLATPVAPSRWRRELADVADELVCVATPEPFHGVGEWYRDFAQTTDDDVTRCLADRVAADGPAGADPPDRDESVRIEVDGVELAGRLTVPDRAHGVVVFAHGSGSSRLSPRNRYVARVLNRAGLATLLFDLLTPEEELDRANVFDIELLARRLGAATTWLRRAPGTDALPIGYFGASTGAAAALWAAAEPGAVVTAVVSRGGRPDLAGPRLPAVRAPTLLIVGGADRTVLALNRQAQARLRCESRLAVVRDATHLFGEPGALERVATLACDWLIAHLAPAPAEVA